MLRIESEREEDGRWIAELPALPGVLAYGVTETEAQAKAKALALRVIADRLETANRCRARSPASVGRISANVIRRLGSAPSRLRLTRPTD